MKGPARAPAWPSGTLARLHPRPPGCRAEPNVAGGHRAATVIISPVDLAEFEATLVGIHSARRGTYRVLYRINDDRHGVIVLRIEHRNGAHRPR